jgi:hypothetical protein
MALLTEQQYHEKLEETKTMNASIEESISLKSHNFIAKEMHKIDGYLDRVSVLLNEAIENKSERERNLKTKEVNFQLQCDGELADNKEIQELKSSDLRKAKLNTKFKQNVEEVNIFEGDLILAKAFYEQISNKYSRLTSKLSSLTKELDTFNNMLTTKSIISSMQKKLDMGGQ